MESFGEFITGAAFIFQFVLQFISLGEFKVRLRSRFGRDLDLDLDLDLEPQKSKSSRNRGMSTLKADLDCHDFACRMSCRVGVQIRCSALKSGEYHRKTRYYRTNDVAWFTCLSSVKD